MNFPGAGSAARRYIAANPERPLGHTALAAGFLFSGLNRIEAISSPTSEEKLRQLSD